MNREPVGYTCGKIDEVLKAISIIEDLSSQHDLDTDKLIDVLSEINNLCYMLDVTLEEVRNDNSDLREWGNKEAERVDELEKEIDALQDELIQTQQ